MTFDLQKAITGQLHEMGKNMEQYAGSEIREKVMQGSQEAPSTSDAAQGALGLKEAIDRLDALADRQTCKKIMNACGRHCHSLFDHNTPKLIEQRRKYATEREFLENIQPADDSMRHELEGDDLISYFYPEKLVPGFRCACFLIGGLPKGVNASPTFCECSRGFMEKRWEDILGRPVGVDIKETAITGSDRCVFIIHL